MAHFARKHSASHSPYLEYDSFAMLAFSNKLHSCAKVLTQGNN